MKPLPPGRAFPNAPGLSFGLPDAEEVLLPSQFFPPLPLKPQWRLALAVLEDAVKVIQKYPPESRQRQRDEDWVASDDLEWPYSFRNVCEYLGIDADRLRRKLTLATIGPKRPRFSGYRTQVRGRPVRELRAAPFSSLRTS